MKIKTIYVSKWIILCLIIIAGGCSEKGDVDQVQPNPDIQTVVQGDIERGRLIYEKYCFYCHGREGRGNGAIGIAITPHPTDFVGDTERMAKSDKELFRSITEGIHRDTDGEAMRMPRWKDILTKQNRWDVLTYIRYLSKKGREGN